MTTPTEAAAVLTVVDAATMTVKARKQLAKWLRMQADALEGEGTNYAACYRARYLITPARKRST